MGLEVDRRAEPKETDGSEDRRDQDQREAELGLVYAPVLLGEVYADPVVEGPRDDLADDGEDKGREADEAGLADGEVVRRSDEDDGVDDGEDYYPCDCSSWVFDV